ncbi:MAG: lysophospholipid acyltransferase family protein [Thermomicrobiales bacterium]
MSALAAVATAWLARVASGPTVTFGPDGPPARQSVFFANHQSHLDFMVIWSVLVPDFRDRTRPIAAKEYWTANALRRYLSVDVFHAVLVDRERPSLSALRGELDVLLAALDAGDSLIIFPEGTRGSGDRIAPFKGGIDFLARERPAIDLVPVHLSNLERIMPKGEFLPVPQLSSITFGAPIHRRADESKTDFLARARQAVIELEPKQP